MGLSGEERIERIYYIVGDLTDWGREVKSCRLHLKEFTDITDELWHDVLGSSFENTDFWLVGGTADREISQDNFSPWSVIVRDYIYDAVNGDSDILPIDNDILRTSLNIESFLSKSYDEGVVYIYRLYKLCEALSYPLKRYNDDFLKEFEKLNRSLSRLVGMCFDYMRDCRDSYSKAYLANRISLIIYSNNRSSNRDWLTEFCCVNFVNIDLLKIMDWDLTDIISVHVGLLDRLRENDNDYSKIIFDRVLSLAKIISTKYKKEGLLKLCEDNLTSKQVDIIEKVLESCELEKKESLHIDHSYDVYGYFDLDKVRDRGE